MKFYVSSKLYNLKKEPIKSGDKEATLGDVAIQALTGEAHEDQKTTGEIRFRRWNLAKKIQKALDKNEEFCEMSVDDVKVIKDRIGSTFFTAVVGAAYDAIESPSFSPTSAE